MMWRRTTNQFLDRAGYQLIRSDSLEKIRAGAERDKASRRKRRLEKRAKAEKAAQAAAAREAAAKEAASKPKPPAKLPADYEQDVKEIWELVRERTMIGHDKVNYLSEAVRYVERYDIPGSVVECGVWRGGAMLTVAHTLDRLGNHERDLYLYDTFSGMPDATDRDVHIWNNMTAEEVLASKSKAAPIWQPASLQDVQEGFESVDYPSERVHYVVGKVEETIPAQAPDQIAILRLDTDWYESTKHEFAHLYERLVPGGVLIIDDYGSWQGSKEATDEFLKETGEPLMLARIGRGRAAIKPGLATQVLTKPTVGEQAAP